MDRGYSRRQMEEMGFDRSQYAFPTVSGRATGTLVMKEWGKSKCLMCYFDLDDGEKLVLSVWWDSDGDRAYRPKNSDLDLSMIEIGSRMEIVYGLTASGKSRFLEADVLK